jgi:hypothetical protein
MHRPLRWSTGITIGLIASIIGVLVLLLAGLLTGRGSSLIAEAGDRIVPQALASVTGLGAGTAYLVVHTVMYVMAGLATVLLTRVGGRAHVVLVGLVLVLIFVEFGSLEFATEAVAQGRIDPAVWRAVLTGHVVADLAFALMVVRAHPGLLTELREGYET